jgi:signal transduction histidine kinase
MKKNQNNLKKTHTQRDKLVKAGAMHWVHWLVVILSILLTIGAWYFSKTQLEEKIEERFNREADQVVELVKERMKLYENALWGGVSLIDANGGDISFEKWLIYSKSLHIDKTYPGINGIGVIYNIHPTQLEEYLKKERSRRPEYSLHPEHDQAEYWPITFVEPVSANKKAIGLDMAFETNRYTGIKKARDTGRAQLTGPITLVQDSKKTPGFLFYTPFYKNGEKPSTKDERRKKIVGVTYAPFIMSKLMAGTLAKESRHVNIRITDREELLFDDVLSNSDSIFRKKANVEFYGRIWRFEIQANESFEKAAANSQPLLILMGGIVIDGMLLALFLFLSKANRQALSYADQMTVSLKKSNDELERFAYVSSHDLKSPLRAIYNLSQWIFEEVEDKLSPEGKENAELLKKRVQRMENLINDLLQFSRVGREDYEVEKINTGPLFRELFELQDSPDGFSLKLAADLPVFDSYKSPLQQLFLNFISNAIKHHDDPSNGELTVECFDKTSDFFEFVISDNGPGIPTALRENAISMFQTLQSRDETEGTGLGLSIVKKIVEEMGGVFSIDPQKGRGCTFRFTWPKTMVEKGAK